MNLNEFLQSNTEQLQSLILEFLNNQCIINGQVYDLSEIERIGYDTFSFVSKRNMPVKLYKYFSNKVEDGINYSIQALKNNTVYLQSPVHFDDVYDSDIGVDFSIYERKRLIEYCKRSNIDIILTMSTEEIKNTFVDKIKKMITENINLDLLFNTYSTTEKTFLENDLFIKSFLVHLSKENDVFKSVSKVLIDEYNAFIDFLKSSFRISCFTTSPYSQLMWGVSYADCHRGFCVEYTVAPDNERYKSIYHNLFPVIYSKKKTDISEKLLEMRNNEISIEDMWRLHFHGVLRKSIDWIFQNEWRLIIPDSKNLNYNIDFFPITKVFLGNRMSALKRKEIIDICNEKNIPYIGVKKNLHTFEMEECDEKCENCASFINSIQELR